MMRRSISRAASAASVGVETIRFYERKRLIEQPPKPLSGGCRVYSDKTIERVRFIRQAQDLGFSLREIEELLSLRADPSTDCADVRARAETKLEEINQKLRQLKCIQQGLKQLIAACPGQGAVQACSIIDALEDARAAPKRKRRSNYDRKSKHPSA